MKITLISKNLRKWFHLSVFCCLVVATQCNGNQSFDEKQDTPPKEEPTPIPNGVTEDLVDG